MPVIKGVIYSPTGTPVAGATLTLTSLHNRAGILKSVVSQVTARNGEYCFTLVPGIYSVRLTTDNRTPSEIGVIRVYDDSQDGTLNDFLGASEIDLRPEALRHFEYMVDETARNAQESAAARDDARELVENPVVIVPTSAELPESPRGLYLVEADEVKGGGPQIYYYPGSGRRFWFASVEDVAE